MENNNITRQALSTLNIDFSKVSLATKKRSASETSEETYAILKTMYTNFSGLSPRDDSKEHNRDFQTVTELVYTYFLLNEVLLGKVVGDKDNLEENIYFETVLQNLSVRLTLGLISMSSEESIGKVDLEGDKKSIIESARGIFKERLKLLTGFQEVALSEKLEFFIKPQLSNIEPKEIAPVPGLKRPERPHLELSVAVALSKLKHLFATSPTWYWRTIAFSVLTGLVVFWFQLIFIL